MNEAGAVLALEHIAKAFGGTAALTDASLALRAGTVHALLGENGAGKTTLMRIAYGMLRPDTGVVRVDGRPHRFASPADAIAAGVGMVHQHFTLLPDMTVAENVALGGEGRYDPAAAAARVQAVSADGGLALDPHAPVSALSPSVQQRVEIVKALAREARVLILDEPTAVLAPGEADDLLRRLRAFADSGRSVILITHKLREALGVADDITVLRRGATTYSASRAASTETSLIEAMLGAATRPTVVKRSERGAGAVVIRARDLVVTDERGAERVKQTSFEIAAGEIVGVAGIEGSGHRELLRALAGRRQPTRARSLQLPPTIGFVPDDRHREAIIPEMSLTENFALRNANTRRGRIRWAEMASRTRAVIERFDIRASGPEASIRTLSGGNQQRFVLARELDGPPDVVVVENPTRGLDVRASSDILARLAEARDRGVAVIMYSADLDEVLSLADRVLVLFAGMVRELPPDRELVGRAMLGAA